jgi:hypothetical protein
MINTGGSTDLARILGVLSPEAAEHYPPAAAVRVSHSFSSNLAAFGFYQNNSIQDATKAAEREKLRASLQEAHLATLKSKLDKEAQHIARLQRKLVIRQRGAVCT